MVLGGHCAAVLHGLGHMADLRVLRTCQISDGTRHFECAVRAARRPAKARRCHVQKLQCIRCQQGVLVNGLAL